jgi:hypothetical protein
MRDSRPAAASLSVLDVWNKIRKIIRRRKVHAGEKTHDVITPTLELRELSMFRDKRYMQ